MNNSRARPHLGIGDIGGHLGCHMQRGRCCKPSKGQLALGTKMSQAGPCSRVQLFKICSRSCFCFWLCWSVQRCSCVRRTINLICAVFWWYSIVQGEEPERNLWSEWRVSLHQNLFCFTQKGNESLEEHFLRTFSSNHFSFSVSLIAWISSTHDIVPLRFLSPDWSITGSWTKFFSCSALDKMIWTVCNIILFIFVFTSLTPIDKWWSWLSSVCLPSGRWRRFRVR